MLAHRLRRRASIGPALGQRVVFSGIGIFVLLNKQYCIYYEN